MNDKIHSSEKGQAIVYLVIGLVVFLGFVALAIDGGMALADRRNSQNAADAASLAGGGKAAIDITNAGINTNNWSCSMELKNHAEEYAQSRGAANGFNNITSVPNSDEPGSVNNYAVAKCGSDSRGDYIDVTVDILSETQSNFLQLIFPNALQNHVVSVTRVYAGGPLANGNAIVALNDESCAGASKIGAGFRGNSDTHVTGGGIWSNGCLTGGGSATVIDTECKDDQDHDIPCHISYNDFFGDANKFTPTPENVSPAQIPPSTYDVGLPDCSKTSHNVASLPLFPTVMEPGLWCLTGNLKINANDEIHGDGVTIYIPNGYLDIAGGAKLKLSAPVDDPTNPDEDYPSPAILGLLFYLPSTNHDPVTINGNSDLFSLTGTILAPGSHIKIDGTSNNTLLDTQIIGWDVELIGTATFNINYKASENGSLSTSMELHK